MSRNNNSFLNKTDLDLANELAGIETKLDKYNKSINILIMNENEVKELKQSRKKIIKEISEREKIND